MVNPKLFTTNPVIIKTSWEEVLNLLFHQFGATKLFNSNIKRSYHGSGKPGGIGCERKCSINQKTIIAERVSKLEALKSLTIDATGRNMPMLKEMQVIYLLHPVSQNQTKVSISTAFTTRPSFIALIMKGMFTKMMFAVLVGLKYLLETGFKVSKVAYKGIYSQYKAPHSGETFKH